MQKLANFMRLLSRKPMGLPLAFGVILIHIFLLSMAVSYLAGAENEPTTNDTESVTTKTPSESRQKRREELEKYLPKKGTKEN
jgi:hypothetical protein